VTAQTVLEVEYRRCIKRPGLTKYIVFCPICLRILEPTRVELSSTGAHGREFYTHEHEVEWVRLEQTNTGKRKVSTSPFLRRYARLLEFVWVHKGCSVEEVVSLVQELLDSIARTKELRRNPPGGQPWAGF